MKLRSRRTLVVAASVLAVSGGGAAFAQTQQSGGGDSQTQESPPASARNDADKLGRDTFLDDVASRLGIERSKLDSALGERGEEGTRRDFGLFGLEHFGFPGFTAAAEYLGLSPAELRAALAEKMPAEVAADQGKSVDGLKQALRGALKDGLDEARSEGAITQEQENALLQRFDSTIDDVVNGRSPFVTELAARLGIDRAKEESALEGAAADQVDEALAQGLITQAQANELKQRIESGAGAPFGFGLGFGLGPGCRGGGPGPGPDREPGLGFGFRGPGEDLELRAVPGRFL